MAALKRWGYPLASVEELVIDPVADRPTGTAVHSASDDEAHDAASEAETVGGADHETENLAGETG